jgi:hypothetical protein
MDHDVLQVDQQRLVEAWQGTLPTTLNTTDSAEVVADEADRNSLRVHIKTAGRSDYSFDFKVTYVDSREVAVELVDVEQGEQTVDERNEIIQGLVEDYVRHIHESAQVLHELTHH